MEREIEKSVGLSSQFVAALILVSVASANNIAKSDAHPALKHPSRGAAAASNQLPESKALVQNDNLVPTQNRTQAMALEAENGHLPAAQEQQMNRSGYSKAVNADHRR